MVKHTCILTMAGALAFAAPLASAQTAPKEMTVNATVSRNSTRPAPPSRQVMPCNEVGHGVVREIGSALDFSGGEEMTCWEFTRDDGKTFELITNQKLFDGVPATIFGNPTDSRTKCYAGAPTEACAVVYDDVRESVGMLALEDTCWTFTAGSMKFTVANPADLVDIEGLDQRLSATPARVQLKYIETTQAPTKELCFLLPIYALGGRVF